MSTSSTSKRRTFLATVGAAITGGMWSRSAGAQSSADPRINRASIPYEPEVLVIGGGPAGIGAALGAARAGAKTLLLENHAFFGGVASWCLGMPINQMRPGSRERSVIHELIIQKLLAYGDQAVRIGTHQLWCNVDYLKVAAPRFSEGCSIRVAPCNSRSLPFGPTRM